MNMTNTQNPTIEVPGDPDCEHERRHVEENGIGCLDCGAWLPDPCKGIGVGSYCSPAGHDYCTVCGRTVTVRKNGTVGKHKPLVFDADGKRTDR